MQKNIQKHTYLNAGVDIEKGNRLIKAIKPLVASTKRAGTNAELGGFGSIFDLKAAGFNDPILVSSNDGVGTKIKIAIETNTHNTIGIDLVAMCVNDILVHGAEPIFFLDYFAAEQLSLERDVLIINGIVEGCRQAGCALIGGETAEMPGLYQKNDYDLAGFCVGVAERGRLLPAKNIEKGDLLLGIASSGLHSNGFSLVRSLVKQSGLEWSSKAPFAEEKNLGQALLEPTRIYVQPVLKAMRNSSGIKGAAHITGGGLHENIPRILPQSLCAKIHLDAINVPPIFSWLSQIGTIEQQEMIQTFNCGIGMVLVIDPLKQEEIQHILQEEQLSTTLLGEIIERESQDIPIVYDGAINL